MPIYPVNSNEMVLENYSEIYFHRHLPHKWICEKPNRDIGIDQRIEIIEDDGCAKGLELLVQLKSSLILSSSEQGNHIKISGFKVSTYNYLYDKLQVVMIVKYVKEIDKAFWILLKDVNSPNQENKTFTISIPKENMLDTINWRIITDYIQDVHYRKLRANR